MYRYVAQGVLHGYNTLRYNLEHLQLSAGDGNRDRIDMFVNTDRAILGSNGNSAYLPEKAFFTKACASRPDAKPDACL